VPHGISLITTLAAAFGLALVLGFLAVRVRLPALVGYLVAGMIIGPATPGFVADQALSAQLAEIGVMLLMFGVGLHFSIEDLWSVRKIAIPGAVGQIAVATVLGAVLAASWGWSLTSGIVFGLALSVASTVVLLRALEDHGMLDSMNGRIAVGWLVVEDLVTVLVLVVMPSLATAAAGPNLVPNLAWALGRVAVFVAFMLVVGRRVFPWLLWQVARTGSRELFTLCVIAAAVGIAYGSSLLFGVSFALGAFFAGIVMRGSELSERAAEESLPLRDAFSVLFFVAAGILFDPRVIVDEPLRLLAVLAIVVLGKSVAALGIVLALRYPLGTALTVSAALAQIGEFSFILAGLGVALGLISAEAQALVVATAVISIALNPLVFGAVAPFRRWAKERSRLARELETRDDPLAVLPSSYDVDRLSGHVVVVGYGRVGRPIVEALQERGVPFTVAEQEREIVEELRGRGIAAVFGDAGEPGVLIQAHVARARVLVVTTLDTFRTRKMLDVARALRPDAITIVRAASDDEAVLLAKEHANGVLVAERELAASMARRVLEAYGEK
jgi:CPA2 family monovalent cation:H+ antiporter-2